MAQSYRSLVLACFSLAVLGRRVQVDIASHQQPLSTLAPSQTLASLLLMMDSLPVARHRPVHGALNSRKRILSSNRPQMNDEATATATDDSAGMTMSVKMLPKSAIALDVVVPVEIETKVHMEVLQDCAKDVDIPGFNKKKGGGLAKAPPPQLVLQHVGKKKVKAYTIEKIVDLSLKSTDIANQIKIIGEARLPETIEKVVDRYRIGKGINYTLEVDVVPRVDIDNSTYTGLSLTVEKVPFNSEEYEKSQMTLKKRHYTVTDLPKGTAAELGNQVIANMNGFFANADGTKGDPLPAIASGDAVPIKMETGVLMPGIVEGVLGMKEGEKRDITTKMPNRAGAQGVDTKAIADKDIIFEIECLAVQSLTLPEWNEDFANIVKPGMTLKEMEDKLKEGVSKQGEEELDFKTRQGLKDALAKRLPEDFEVPETMINSVTKEAFAEMLSQQRDEGKTDEQIKAMVTEENYKTYSKIILPQVTERVKIDLAIETIAAIEGLEISRKDVDEEIMAQQMQATQRKQKFKESEVRPKIEAKMQQNMVLDFIKSKASIEYIEAEDDGQTSMKEAVGETPEEMAARLKGEGINEDALREELEKRDAALKNE